MDLLQNPFYILGASPRDNRQQIMELAEQRSLLQDPGVCMEAASNLTNPRKRLAAEIAWLPSIGPRRTEELFALLETSPANLLEVKNLSPIARTNLLASGLARLADYNTNEVANWITKISWSFEELNPDELRILINEDRVVSKFPEVSDLTTVEDEIQKQRSYFNQVFKSALDNLPTLDLIKVITDVVESETRGGEMHGPILLDDLVDSFEVEALNFLEKEGENIKTLIKRLYASFNDKLHDARLSSAIEQLIKVVKNWDLVAQPIQVSARSRGLKHKSSHEIADLVRKLADKIYTKHGKLNFSQQLTRMLQEVFAEVDEISERTADDAARFKEIAEESASQ